MRITGKATSPNFQIGENQRYFHGKRIPRTWIMVVDRKKAHVFNKTSSGLELIADAHPDKDDQGLAISNHDIGRNVIPFSGHHSGIDPREDQQRHEEFHFARGLSDWIEEASQRGAFERLVLVASPRMLGDIRDHLPGNVRERVIGEIAKDLTNMSIPDIKRNLSNVVYFRD